MADSIRLNRTMNHIEANLGLWDQGNWARQTACGTVYCFAGWAVTLEGIQVCLSECSKLGGPHVHRDQVPDRFLRRMSDPKSILSVAKVARMVLDLSHQEGFDLFCSRNDLEKLQDQVRRLTENGNDQ